MGPKHKSEHNFFLDFFKKNETPNCYTGIEFIHSPNTQLSKNELITINELSNIYLVHLIPNYLELTIQPGLQLIKIPQLNNGYGINLNDYSEVESYVKDQFKKYAKKIFTRFKRLQLCFDIKFVEYSDNITEEEYKFLMRRFKEMLERRFEQRNDRHDKLEHWDNLYQSVLPMLKNKRASLFVIFDGVKPIQITLHYHLQNILFSAIPAYDIDYDKFGLGNTAVYKKIEWCLENGIKFIEMGYGDLEYKRRWSNTIYKYNTHIVYKNGSGKIKFQAYLQYLKITFKEYLKKKGIKESYRKYISILKNKDTPSKKKGISTYKEEDLGVFPQDEKNTLLNMEDEKNSFLRKAVYDFQYVSFAPSQSISVYRSDLIQSSYLITDNKKYRRITF